MFPLKSTKFKEFKKNIFGFDIETYDKNKKFYCASIFGLKHEHSHVFLDKQELIDFFKKKMFWNSIIVATNLSFDFFGSFFNEKEMQKFRLLLRGSNLLTTKTYLKHGDFTSETGIYKLEFVDTMNYTNMSVNSWGNFLKLPKLNRPKALGKLPKNNKEKQELITYNKRDSEISAKALKFLYDMFQRLGATPKTTIASTSMSLFKNKFLKDKIYWRHDEHILLNQFEGYYGGRVEAFARGKFKNYNYYDFNSLYPSVMLNEYPDPNSLRISTANKVKYIDTHEGMARVTISSQSTTPLLPFHHDDKVMFANGTMTGWFTNIELRKAVDEGAVIKRVYTSYYYKDVCYPFQDYIKELYDLRKEMKKEENPMQFVCKLMMNSLYGKFGQKFLDKDNLIPADVMTLDMIKGFKEPPERLGDFFRVKKDCRPANFCFPIWAAYTTAYGRLKLHDYIKRCKPLYVDTDSLITRKEFDTSDRLGALKLEHFITEGLIIRPKFYMMKTKERDIMKIKGVSTHMTARDFINIVSSGKTKYNKFMKIRESLRRGFIPNEIQEVVKELSLEDNKRVWGGPFNMEELQFSKPINIDDAGLKPCIKALHIN